MTGQRLTSLNNSTSKQFYSFSKGDRFPDQRLLNQKVSYQEKSEFDVQKAGGSGRPFFQTSSRFDYYRSPQFEKKQPQPSPLQYKIKGTFGDDTLTSQKKFSFGVSRDNMKKIHVDDIRVQGGKSPGPGKYSGDKTESGISFSMAARLPTEKQQLEKASKLPGPGKYSAIEVCGKDLVHSLYKTQSKFSFGKAQDRFVVPTKKVASPSPDKYKPMNNLNQNINSTF